MSAGLAHLVELEVQSVSPVLTRVGLALRWAECTLAEVDLDGMIVVEYGCVFYLLHTKSSTQKQQAPLQIIIIHI